VWFDVVIKGTLPLPRLNSRWSIPICFWVLTAYMFQMQMHDRQ
jgi:hypothetical protein